ncbi:MAG: hypothetical protein R3E02_05045 [Blastomonas sp.]
MDSAQLQLSPLDRLILAYARAQDRPIFAAVFALDAQLAAIVRDSREPVLGQMRLQWWHDVISMPAGRRPRGNPLVNALGKLDGAGSLTERLLPMVDGWEELLVAETLDGEMIAGFAMKRGATMFAFLADSLGEPLDLAAAGRAWAQWDLARNISEPVVSAEIFGRLAQDPIAMKCLSLPRRLRPLSIRMRLMQIDILRRETDRPLMRPVTAWRVIRHGLIGG